MNTAAKVLFLLGAIPTIGGIAILVALAHTPRTARDHFQGVYRYLIVFGAALSSAQVLMGWTPPWPYVVLMLGLGCGMGMHAREHNLIALASEKIEQSARDAGA